MAEFNIRLFAFRRISERQDLLFREVAYYSMIGSHLDPKKIPKNKNDFWSIGNENNTNKERHEKMRIAMQKAIENYNNRKNV